MKSEWSRNFRRAVYQEVLEQARRKLQDPSLSKHKRAGVEWARNDAYELLFDLIQEDSPCH